MKRFVIEYTLPYTHRVQVGIQADTEAQAIQQASEAFDAGTIWDDTLECPLLFDDFEENGDAGIPLEFSVMQTLDPAQSWPAVDHSVLSERRNAAARKAASLLATSFEEARDGAPPDRNILNLAYQTALAAVRQ